MNSSCTGYMYFYMQQDTHTEEFISSFDIKIHSTTLIAIKMTKIVCEIF